MVSLFYHRRCCFFYCLLFTELFKVGLGAYLFEIVGIGLAISVMAFVGGDIYKKELCEVIYEECKIEENNIIILEKLKRGR